MPDTLKVAVREISSYAMSVTTTISGSVINSQVITAGGDVVVLASDPSNLTPEESRVLLASMDWELLDLTHGAQSPSVVDKLRRDADLELRVLLVAIPPEGAVVLPPTYYCETPLCRDLLQDNRYAIEHGYIRLLTEYIDHSEYVDRKQARYEKAAHFDHYKEAYFKPSYPGFWTLPFASTSKYESVGSKALKLWSALLESADALPLQPEAAGELRRRVYETERPAFLWENVAEHLEKIGVDAASASASQLRLSKNRCYLSAYQDAGISVMSGSKLISELVAPHDVGRAYNVRAWISILSQLGVLDFVESAPLPALVSAKTRPEVSETIGLVRRQLSRGQASDVVFGHLNRTGLAGPFAEAMRRP